MFLGQGYKKEEHEKAQFLSTSASSRAKNMDEDIQWIMCASLGDITEAIAQEYNKNQEVVWQAC